jgi:hypothetical protein
MKQYRREDGIQCLAIQFIDGAEANPAHVFELLTLLNNADLNAIHVKEALTDEWQEVLDEEGDVIDYEQIIISEHIAVQQSQDRLFIDDYIVLRDGDTYVQDYALFESIWSEAITENMDEWRWQPAKRPKGYKKAGLWEHVRDEDVISLDGGLSYFRESERPLYQTYGQLYKSDVPIIQEFKV